MTGREFILELLDKGYPISLETEPEYDTYEVTVGDTNVVSIHFSLEGSDCTIRPINQGSQGKQLDEVVKGLHNMSMTDWTLPYEMCNGGRVHFGDIPKIIGSARNISNINIDLREETIEIISEGKSFKAGLKITT